MPQPILVVGTMAFDTIETPFEKAAKALGGSANHFSISASHFAPVRCVSVIGEDFPESHLDYLKSRQVDTSGIHREKGKTFHWSGRYGYDLHEAQTLETALNVFEKFDPKIPPHYQDSPFVFLGNLSPVFQKRVLSQVQKPKLIALDTMNFWIEGQRSEVISAMALCHTVIINEAEARQLTKTHNIVRATQQIHEWGPQTVVIKRGEYGALVFHNREFFSLPGLPLAEVKDPTGAGDSFAGGFMGYLASQLPPAADARSISLAQIKKAVVYGSVMASYIVEDFSFSRLTTLSPTDIESRFQRFSALTQFS